MTFRQETLCICVCALTALCPALGAAVRVQACTIAKPTAASYTWNFSQEANQDFREILADARNATTTADRLVGIIEAGHSFFEDNSDLLNRLKMPVNDIGAQVCRLEAIRRVVAPWQRTTIDQIVSSVTLMADNTENAIDFLTRHPNYRWNPSYLQYIKNVYSDGSHLSTTLDHAVKYASVNFRDKELRQEVGSQPLN